VRIVAMFCGKPDQMSISREKSMKKMRGFGLKKRSPAIKGCSVSFVAQYQQPLINGGSKTSHEAQEIKI